MIRRLTFAEAVNLALMEEMAADESVIVFGVDVPDHKRTFGSGAGLLEKFGPARFFGSPLSEAGATGVAIGAALAGLRPVHIHARSDFLLLAMNQLCNMAAIKSYVSEGRESVPLTVRALIGRSWGQGPQHSKAMHGVLAHFPGLKVVLPSSPQEGYSLLRAAIRDPNPVIVFEHRWCYSLSEDVDDAQIGPLEGCRVLRPGRDIALVGISWMVQECLQACDILARAKIEAAVIDVRSASPLDIETIRDVAGDSMRLIVADNDWLFGGLSAEIVSQVVEGGVSLQGLARLGFAQCPCPTTRPLENLFYPSAREIVRAAERMLGLAPMDLSQDVFNEYERRFKGPF